MAKPKLTKRGNTVTTQHPPLKNKFSKSAI